MTFIRYSRIANLQDKFSSRTKLKRHYSSEYRSQYRTLFFLKQLVLGTGIEPARISARASKIIFGAWAPLRKHVHS